MIAADETASLVGLSSLHMMPHQNPVDFPGSFAGLSDGCAAAP
jgi:hypothetical protein